MRIHRLRPVPTATFIAVVLLLVAACGGETSPQGETSPPHESSPAETATAENDGGVLTVYSGRSEDLVGPILDRFEEETGTAVEVRYGDTAEMAAQILEEGDNSPADVFFGQDAGALGALAKAGRLQQLPEAALGEVDERFRSPDGLWIGISGRARTVVHNTDVLDRDDVPDSVLDLTDPEWEGRVGWAPTNGSFQAFVTAMRVTLGEETTREWLEGMLANDVKAYESNTPIVEATGRGEIDLGLVNHYYLFRFKEEDPGFPAANAFLSGDIGTLVNVAGVGVVDTTDQQTDAERLVRFLLSEDAQTYFATETFEYPLVAGIPHEEDLPDLSTIDTPDIDLSDLDDLQGTLELLREVGALE